MTRKKKIMKKNMVGVNSHPMKKKKVKKVKTQISKKNQMERMKKRRMILATMTEMNNKNLVIKKW